MELDTVQDAQRQVDAIQSTRNLALGVQDNTRRVPALDGAQQPRVGINLSRQQGHETCFARLLQQHRVYFGQNLADIGVRFGERAKVRMHGCHQDGWPDPVTAYVADHDQKRTVLQMEIVEMVSGGELGCVAPAVDVESGKFGWSLRQKVLLDIPVGNQLRLLLANPRLGCFVIGDIQMRTDHSIDLAVLVADCSSP